MGAIITLAALTLYLAFTSFLGFLLYKRFEKWSIKTKEHLEQKAKERAEKQEQSTNNNDLENEVERLRKLVEASNPPVIPAMESI